MNFHQEQTKKPICELFGQLENHKQKYAKRQSTLPCDLKALLTRLVIPRQLKQDRLSLRLPISPGWRKHTLDTLNLMHQERWGKPEIWKGREIARAIIVDWIAEVCSDYLFKRETFHSAVLLFDMFAETKTNASLQLIAVTCLFLSAKFEEVATPNIESLLLVGNNAFKGSEIRALEPKILCGVDYNLSRPTLSTWASYITYRWDSFCAKHEFDLPCFRNPSILSYTNMRKLLLRIDCAIMDTKVLEFSPAVIVATFLQLQLVSIELKPKIRCNIQTVFLCFIEEELTLDFKKIEEFVPIAKLICGIKPKVGCPISLRLAPDIVRNSSFEEFLAYQTYQSGALRFIVKQIKGNKY